MPYADQVKQRKAQREWRRRRREEWLNEHGPCVLCRSWDNLEVDHIDPETKVSHNIWNWEDTKRNAELEKCQALCGDCHKRKTMIDRLPDHGTDSRYRHRRFKCRCEPCKEAHAEEARKWRL